MTEKAKAIGELTYDQAANITVRICSKTGAIFQEIFPVNQTTFAYVKYLAVEFFWRKTPTNETENYKLISIESKRTMNEQRTLREEKVKDGDEYFLARKFSNQSSEIEQTSPIDEELIQIRTKDLPIPSNLFLQNHPSLRRMEFRTDLNRILLTLVETSHRLLWYRSDAEEIFRHVERILSKSSTQSEEIQINPSQVNQLIDIGFTEKQARFALKRTKSDFNAAMELLLTEPEIDDDNENEQQNSATTYSHPSSFISFHQFRQKYFQPNPIAIRALEDMGFGHDEIITALRICHNDQNLACDYLIGDKRQRDILIASENEQGLDSDSNLFKALMDNATVQRAVNNPKVFFIILHLYENPNLVTFYINETEIGNLLIQLSRIYYTERYQTDQSTSNHQQESNAPRITDDANDD